MKLLAMSDIHCQWNKFSPEALTPGKIDGVVIAGDLTQKGDRGSVSDWYSAYGFFESWRQYLNKLAGCNTVDTAPIMWVAGNHDFGAIEFAQHTSHLATFIQDQLIVTPWGLTIRGFNLSTCFDLPSLANRWARTTACPQEDFYYFNESWEQDSSGDIIVSHSPPLGCLDLVPGKTPCHIGSPGLRTFVDQHNPKLLICGHVHEDAGFKPAVSTPFYKTEIYNVAQRAVVIELGAPST